MKYFITFVAAYVRNLPNASNQFTTKVSSISKLKQHNFDCSIYPADPLVAFHCMDGFIGLYYQQQFAEPTMDPIMSERFLNLDKNVDPNVRTVAQTSVSFMIDSQ